MSPSAFPARASMARLLALFLTLVIGFPAHGDDRFDLAAITRVWPDQQPLNDGWAFALIDADEPPAADDGAWEPVALPHTWNALDTLQRVDYRRAAAWYRRTLDVRPADLADRLYLRFLAAGQAVRVRVNGVAVGDHAGGYAAFTFEVTPHLHVGTNMIEVWVSNRQTSVLPPLDIDHNQYGGLYRGVDLLRAPVISLARTAEGGPGVYAVSQGVTKDRAPLRVHAALDNGATAEASRQLVVHLLDDAGRAVAFAATRVTLPPGRTDVTLDLPEVVAPRLWSPATPHLYTLRVELWDERNLADVATVPHGFRFFEFTPDRGFFLNGERLEIRGVNRHQDVYRRGNAVAPEDHLRDFLLIKELGANAVRLAHYQQDDVVLALCDRLGLLVWEEIPLVNAINETPEFLANTQTMLREMIAQHRAHPSIMIWGLQNEFILKQPFLYPEKRALLQRLNAIAKEMDPTRITATACHGVKEYAENQLTDLADIVGYNMYYGWYNDTFAGLIGALESFRRLDPRTPLLISEFGADSDLRIQRHAPERQDYSEQWQCDMITSYLDDCAANPWIPGVFYWNMFDFGASHRENAIPGVNQKGLVNFDRSLRKDAFFLFKARWSTEPVLHLASARLTERPAGPSTYRAFTNFEACELLHNGVSLGRQTEGFEWQVNLVEGPNHLLLTGTKAGIEDRHGVTVLGTPTP